MIAMEFVMMCVLLSEGMAVKSRMKPDEGHALQHIPGYPERANSHRLKRCFLSKSSTFTDPNMPGRYGSRISQQYWTDFGNMRSVEVAMNTYDCTQCQGYMAKKVSDAEA